MQCIHYAIPEEESSEDTDENLIARESLRFLCDRSRFETLHRGRAEVIQRSSRSYVEVAQRLCRGRVEVIQRSHRGYVEGEQRLRRGYVEVAQRLRRGRVEVMQRSPRGYIEGEKKLCRGRIEVAQRLCDSLVDVAQRSCRVFLQRTYIVYIYIMLRSHRGHVEDMQEMYKVTQSLFIQYLNIIPWLFKDYVGVMQISSRGYVKVTQR